MHAKSYVDIEEFYTICYNFLEEHEAENNLIFGILETLRTNIHAYDPIKTPEFIAIFDNKDIVMVSIRTPPYSQIIFVTDKKDSIPVLVNFLAEKGVELSGILGFTDGALLFAELWTKKKKKNKILSMNERIYKLEQVNPQIIDKNQFENATEEDLDLLIDYAQKFAQETFANTSQNQIERNKDQLTKGMAKWTVEKTYSY